MKSAGFPPIKTLFQDSWQAMVKSLLNLFILTLIGGVIWVIFLVLLFISTVGIGIVSSLAGSGLNPDAVINQYLTKLDPSVVPQFFAVLGLGLLGIVLISIVISLITKTAMVVAVAKYQEKPKLSQCLGQGLKLFFPMIITGSLTFFFNFGGWFLFLLPGLLMWIFFWFVSLEVILAGKRFFSAVKGSVQIVSQNFGEVFGRVILFWVLSWLISYTLNRAFPFLSIFYIFLINWFGLAYAVVLYQQAKAVTDQSKQPRMEWIWVTGILGWLIVGLFVWGGIKLLNTPAVQAKIADYKQEMLGTGKKSEAQIIEDYLNSINDEAKPYWDQSVELFKQIQAASNNPTEVKKLNDQNITVLKKAAELNPENPELWSGLCSAQTWVSTAGTLDDGLKACGKADELAPGMIKYVYNFGDMLMRLGKYEEAVIELEKVLKINDNYGWGHYSLGLAYKNLRMQDSAKEHLQKAIDIWNGINNEGEWGEEILQARKELETAGR